jgi:hypothetical protein
VDNNGTFTAILGVCLFNGLFSPLLPIVFAISPAFLPEFIPMRAEYLFYFSSLVLSTTTLFLAGVPAAIVERLTGSDRQAPGPLYVWLTFALVLSIPSFVRLFSSL